MSEDQTPAQKHYEKHKDSISEARKIRYAEDPEYRERTLQQRRDYLAAKRAEEGKAPVEEVPAEYTHTISDLLGEPPLIGRSTISGWVAKGNLPEPKKFNGVFYFTDVQAEALKTFIKAVEGRKRVFTSGDFTDQIEAVFNAFK